MIEISPNAVIVGQGIFKVNTIVSKLDNPPKVHVAPFDWDVIATTNSETFIQIFPVNQVSTGTYTIRVVDSEFTFLYINPDDYYNAIKNDAKNWAMENWDTVAKSDGDYPSDLEEPPEPPPDDASPEEFEDYNKRLEQYTQRASERAEDFKKAARKTIAKIIAGILARSLTKYKK